MTTTGFGLSIRVKQLLWIQKYFVLIIFAIKEVFSEEVSSSNEFCLAESFNVSCTNDRVLLVNNALYGRMRSSTKCISSSYGHIGCSADVTAYVSDECSTRQRCDMPVSKLLTIASPCPSDVTSYLEVEYRCVTVAGNRCEDNGYQSLSPGGGYFLLSPQLRHISGTVSCPWSLKLGPYQKADFHLSVYGSSGKEQNTCAFTMIFEEDSKVFEKNLCNLEKDKNSLLYQSQGHEIRMYTINEENIPWEERRRYLIRFSVQGCPLLKPPRHSWIIKQDETSATVRCNRTEETWFLACDGQQWKGDMGNCSSTTDVAALGGDSNRSMTAQFPYGFLVAVIIGVLLGIIIGALPLFIVYYCLKRKWRQQMKQDNACYGETLRYVDDPNHTLLKCSYDTPASLLTSKYCTRTACTLPQCSFGTYSPSTTHQPADTYFSDGMQMIVAKQAPSRQQSNTDCGDCKLDVDVITNANCCHGCKGRGPEHVYESASSARKSKIPFEIPTGSLLPVYYDVDVDKQLECKSGVTDGTSRKLQS